MTRRTPEIFLTAVAALAVAGHSPKPCPPLDTDCRIQQAVHLHIHQDGSTLPPIDAKQMVEWTATGEGSRLKSG